MNLYSIFLLSFLVSFYPQQIYPGLLMCFEPLKCIDQKMNLQGSMHIQNITTDPPEETPCFQKKISLSWNKKGEHIV